MKKDKNIEEILSEFDTLFNHDDPLGKALVLFESDPTHAGCTQRPIWKEYRAWLKTALQKSKQQWKKEYLNSEDRPMTNFEAEMAQGLAVALAKDEWKKELLESIFPYKGKPPKEVEEYVRGYNDAAKQIKQIIKNS